MLNRLSYKSFLLLLILVLVGTVSSCKMNNGDIGALYGVWVLEQIKVDGKEYSGWSEGEYNNSFFQFQNNICFVTRTSERFDAENRAGTWQWIVEETEIQLDFSHTDQENPLPGGFRYGSPEWLLLNGSTSYNFEVIWHGEKKMTWQTVNTTGQILTYSLKKTY